MADDKRIVDSDGNEAKVDATLEALKVDVVTADTGILATIDGVLDAIQALLEGTQLSKIWDGTHTLDVNADGSIPVTGAVTIQEPLSIDDNAGSLTVDQATPENLKTLVYGDFGGTPTVIAVDTGGKLKVTFT